MIINHLALYKSIEKGIYNIKYKGLTNYNNTLYSISPIQQIKILSEWQKSVDGGISKTLNITEEKTIEDIFELIILAWENKCKGISIFRQNSRHSAIKIMKK